VSGKQGEFKFMTRSPRPTADLPMWTGALSALLSSMPMHPEGVRFTVEQAEEVIAAIGAALADTELTVTVGPHA